MILTPKPPPDVGRDALDLGQRQVELGRDGGPHAGGRLGGGEEAELLLLGVPTGEDALALHRHARAALDGQVELEHVRCAVQSRLDVTVLLDEMRRHVARHVGVHEVGAVARPLDADDRGQRLVVDPDPLAGVLGEVAVAGDHHHDGLADVVDLVLGQRVRGARVGERRVRDQHGQRLAHPTREVLVGVDGHEAVDVQRVAHVDVDDAGMGVRAAHEGRGQGAMAEVVEVAAPAGDQTRVLLAPDRGAEHLRRHARVSARLLAADLGGTQDGLDDVLVAGAPAEVARDGLARLVLGRLRVLLEVCRDGGEEARRAEAALQAMTLGERLLDGAHGPDGAKPLDRGDGVGLGRHGEHQAGPHGRAVDEHRAGPAHPVLATDVGAGQLQVVAQEVGQQPARRRLRVTPHPVDGEGDVQQFLGGRLAHRAMPLSAAESS